MRRSRLLDDGGEDRDERLLAVFQHHVQALIDAVPLGVFLQEETHAALRILTARDGLVQPRTVQRLAELYREEQEAGNLDPPVDVETLAYAVVRVNEGFIYNDARGCRFPVAKRGSRYCRI